MTQKLERDWREQKFGDGPRVKMGWETEILLKWILFSEAIQLNFELMGNVAITFIDLQDGMNSLNLNLVN